MSSNAVTIALLQIAYYSYALLGMMLFQNKVVYDSHDANVTNSSDIRSDKRALWSRQSNH